MKFIALVASTVLATTMAYGQAAPKPPASVAPAAPTEVPVVFPAGADDKIHDLYQQYTIATQAAELAKHNLEKQSSEVVGAIGQKLQAAYVEFKQTNKLGDDVTYNPETRKASKVTPATK